MQAALAGLSPAPQAVFLAQQYLGVFLFLSCQEHEVNIVALSYTFPTQNNMTVFRSSSPNLLRGTYFSSKNTASGSLLGCMTLGRLLRLPVSQVPRTSTGAEDGSIFFIEST